jgi:hypothetical protein
MAYIKSDMVFFDYNWSENENNNASKLVAGKEPEQLNRTNGFEMLNYINSLAKIWGWKTDNSSSFRHLERIIRKELPADIITHTEILEWIEKNYTAV